MKLQMLTDGNRRVDVAHACINVFCLTFVAAFIVAQIISLFRRANIRKQSADRAQQEQRKCFPQAQMIDKKVSTFNISRHQYCYLINEIIKQR